MAIDVYLADWLSLILRWAHIITGIAWIGSSFYFIWLDARLNVPPRDPENPDVAGDLWAVHGGGFYHAQKYKVVACAAAASRCTGSSGRRISRG